MRVSFEDQLPERIDFNPLCTETASVPFGNLFTLKLLITREAIHAMKRNPE